MEHVLEVVTRETKGSRSSQKSRNEGNIPGVLYGKALENKHFLIEEQKLMEILRHHEKLVSLKIGKDKPVDALIHEVDYEPVSGKVLHLDLHQVKLDEKIEISVPVEMIGSDISPGVVKGGTVDLILHTVTVSCFPNVIPEQLVVDVSEMDIGDSKYVKDLDLIEGIEVVSDAEEVLITMNAPVDIEAETDIEESLKELEEEPTVLKQKEEPEEGESSEKEKE